MDSVMNSQIIMTQNMTQPRKGGGTEKFIDAMLKVYNKAKNVSGLSETARKSILTNFHILHDRSKWMKLSELLTELCNVDRGTKSFDFAHAILVFSDVFENENERRELCVNIIKLLIDILMSKDVSVPNFFGIYNDLNVELAKLDQQGVLELVDHVLEGIRDTERNGEKRVRRFNQRWKDCVGLIVKRIAEFEKIEYNEQCVGGIETAREIVFHWMRIVDDEEGFEMLAEIASTCSFTTAVIEKFCDETIAEQIMLRNGVEEVERKRRVDLTWKAVILTGKVADRDRLHRLWNAAITAWKMEEEDGAQFELSNGLVRCLIIGEKVIRSNLESSKKFLSLIKNEKHRVFESELGFCMALIQCSLDRNDCMLEMKRSLQKLWRAGEQAEECVWMSEIVCGRMIRMVHAKLLGVAREMAGNVAIRQLFTKPVFSLMLALLDTPAYQKQVVIVDGHVADGCALWLMSREILAILCESQTEMSAQLTPLFEAIASASNNNSALILIDVLRELVKKCSIEILNNSKLVDSLFDYVCRMRRDISVSLIRCLLPIINTRPQLRVSLFKNLKKDLLGESTVCSAVPIILMLLKSVSKRREDGGGGQFDHSMSQSFGSFTTQTLNSMGCKKNVDQNVGLELIGIVKRCLWQPIGTKIALYDGICELATQTTTMINQFLDMMLSHARSVPKWRVSEMVIGNKSVVELKEPMGHLIQTIECLMSELAVFDAEFKLDGTKLLLRNAVEQMESWVILATRMDICDLELDKNGEWSSSNIAGKSMMLFAQMMRGVYDVLIEHMWRRVDSMGAKEDADRLIGLLNRRRELEGVVRERTGGRKEWQVVDAAQTEILISAKTLASIMENLMRVENEMDVTLNVRPQIVADVRMELLSWAVHQCRILSGAIVKEYRPLHSIVSGTASIMSLAKLLLEFYVGNEDVPQWIADIDVGTELKTLAVESYANFMHFLAVKYKSSPMRVAMMWFEEKEGEDEESRRKRMEANILILRQSHFLSCRLFRQVLNVENEEIEEEKKPKIMYEAQGKAILKAASAVLNLTGNVKVCSNIFKRLLKIVQEERFGNNQMLRDYTKFMMSCALRCGDSDPVIMEEMGAILENILEFLSEEADEMRFRFITKTSLNVVIDFVFQFVEKTILLIKEAFGFVKEFCIKPPVFDEIMEELLGKCNQISEMVSRCLQIFVQFKLVQERVTEIMTAYFSTIQMGVLLLQGLTKTWGSEMGEWKSVNALAELVKRKLTPILTLVDDRIGFSKGKDEMKKKISQKTRIQKSKRDEKLYVKFSQEREAVQHEILVLCKLIKDDRFDLQVKNNSIGYRDFRIDMEVIRRKIGGENEENRGKKRRMEEEEDRESVEDGGDEEEEEDRSEDVRNQEMSSAEIKNEIEDNEMEDCTRGTSPVF